jgi:tetratricopeptide (TPR) repeat protein
MRPGMKSSPAWRNPTPAMRFSKIGDVLVQEGNLPEALKSYQAGLATAERLAKFDPGNAEWQRDLAVSYGKVGDLRRMQADLAGALKCYSDSLRIRERLAQSDPGNAEWQRDLSVTFARLAEALKQSGDKA